MALLETLVEDFADEASTDWDWSNGNVDVVAGQLRLNIGNYTGLATANNSWSLVNSHAHIETFADGASPLDLVDSQLVFFQLLDGSGNSVSFTRQAETNLHFTDGEGGVGAGDTAVSTLDSWWRFRNDGTVTYWDTSADGVTWTERRSKTLIWTPSAVWVVVAAGHFLSEPEPDYWYVDNFNVDVSVELVVDDATSASTADSVALTQAHVLAAADASSASTADNVALTQAHVLAVADATSASTADNVSLVQAHLLAVDDASSASTADNVSLVQAHVLAGADASSSSTADNVALTQAHTLAVADATSASTADSIALTGAGIDPGVLEDLVDVTVVDTTIEATVL